MKRASFLAVLVVAVGLVSEAVPQEAAKKTDPVKPAPSPSGAILGQWNEIGRKLIAMVEDFPEDKYDFKGAASADGFAQRLIHAAAANYYFTNAAVGKNCRPRKICRARSLPTKRHWSHTSGNRLRTARLRSRQKATKDVGTGRGSVCAGHTRPSRPRADTAGRPGYQSGGALRRSVRGQLTVYYRAAGMMPPEVRLKKADLDIKPTLPDGKIRTYYIAAVETGWDYAPNERSPGLISFAGRASAMQNVRTSSDVDKRGANFSFVIAGGGKEVLGVSTDPGSTWTIDLKKI